MGELREGLPEAGEAEDRRYNELATALATKLMDVGERVDHGEVYVEWKCVAAECIRQMEWARHGDTSWLAWHESSDFGSGDPEFKAHHRFDKRHITVAPDDWKPE